jgi:hypothetical protein
MLVLLASTSTSTTTVHGIILASQELVIGFTSPPRTDE